MTPVDPRLLRASPAVRRFLAACGGLALATAAVIIAQATLIGLIVTRVFLDHAPFARVSGLVLILAALALVRAVLHWAFEAGGHITSQAATSDLRRALVGRVLRSPDVHPAADVATAAVSGLEGLDPYFAQYLPQLALAAVVPLAILIRVSLLDLESAAILALSLPLIPVFGALVGRDTARRARGRYAAMARLGSHFVSVVRGLPTLRAFNRGEVQAERIAETQEAYRHQTIATLRIAFLSAFVLELAAMLGCALVAVEVGVRLDGGGIALAPALTILVLAPELYLPWRNAAAQFHASADGAAAAARVFALIDAPARVPVPAVPREPLSPTDAPVRLRGIRYTHPGGAEEVLRGVDLTLNPGERVALVGSSGSGKSTIVRLLLRFDRPDAGSVEIGGCDLDLIDPDAWRRLVAWMPQRPHLTAGTVAAAIRLGNPRATDREVVRAARLACADRFIRALADGYATPVGDGGRALSTGQLRRLALARALVSDAPLLVLDEPTVSLDPATAGELAGALAGLPRDRTMLLVTHDRELAARVADRVVELHGGRIRTAVPVDVGGGE